MPGNSRLLATGDKKAQEHIESDDLIKRLEAFLGYPSVDPHGDPIPDEQGKMEKIKTQTLSTAPLKKKVRVISLANSSDDFLKYLDKVGKDMSDQLPGNITKAHVQVEFIVDKDGTPTNFKVINGVNRDFDDDLITRLEKMPNWKPAMLHDKAVAKKMKQSFTIDLSTSLTSH